MEITEVVLMHTYNRFNALFFRGKLPIVSSIKFIFDEEKGDTAGYTYINNVGSYTSPLTHTYPDNFMYVIAINRDLCKNEQTLYSVLAHEMIHIYQFTFDFDKYSTDYSWNMSHNRLFVSKMNHINSVSEQKNMGFSVGCTLK